MIKEIKYTKREAGKKMLGLLENNWAVFDSIFMIKKRQNHTSKDRTFFSTPFAKKFIMQITWNMILYHWHISSNKLW